MFNLNPPVALLLPFLRSLGVDLPLPGYVSLVIELCNR